MLDIILSNFFLYVASLNKLLSKLFLNLDLIYLSWTRLFKSLQDLASFFTKVIVLFFMLKEKSFKGKISLNAIIGVPKANDSRTQFGIPSHLEGSK